MAALCQPRCTRAFSICHERGLLFIAVRGLLTAGASLAAENGFCCPMARGVFPDQGSNPVSPALTGGFLTTRQPGKSQFLCFEVREKWTGTLSRFSFCSLSDSGAKFLGEMESGTCRKWMEMNSLEKPPWVTECEREKPVSRARAGRPNRKTVHPQESRQGTGQR